MYRYVKVEGHHYYAGTPPHPTNPLPSFCEVYKPGQLAAVAWFWKESDAKEFCDVMNGHDERTFNAVSEALRSQRAGGMP